VALTVTAPPAPATVSAVPSSVTNSEPEPPMNVPALPDAVTLVVAELPYTVVDPPVMVAVSVPVLSPSSSAWLRRSTPWSGCRPRRSYRCRAN